MLDRHHTLTKFLMELGVDAETAEEDACKMEHDISEQTYAALCRHAIGKLGILGEDDAGLGEDRRDRRNLTHAAGHFRPRQPKLPAGGFIRAAGLDAAARICYAEKEKTRFSEVPLCSRPADRP